MNPKVTVTVPVYNTSKYLRRCLDSLVCQTLKEIEIIIVDDGSTDDSGKVCDEYVSKHPQFKVIHQPNGGLAVARQTGLDNATGEYIIVCDSDDWVEPDMYEKLYHATESGKYDMVFCGYFAEYSDGRSIPKQYLFKNIEGEEFIKEILCVGNHMSWTKLIRRELFLRTGASYEPGINLGEDALILYKLLSRSRPKIQQIEDKLYHYRRLIGEATYTNSVSMKHVMQSQYIYLWMKENFNNDIYFEALSRKASNLVFTTLRSKDLDIQFLKDLINKEIKIIKRGSINFKWLVVISLKIFPVKFVKSFIDKVYPFVYR